MLLNCGVGEDSRVYWTAREIQEGGDIWIHMADPVFMYGRESWTIKEAEH